MKYLITAFLAAAASVGLGAAQQEPFTIEQVMSAPFPSELVAAPAGGMVAWVFDARGVRNIWVAAPPDYKARVLTSCAADDGQEIAELAWTPDARAIVYGRGGDFEMLREAPNPRSDPQGTEQDIWVVTLAGGPPRKLGEGHAPAVSPKGDEVAFLNKDQVWLAKLSGSNKPEQLIHARGKAEGLRWSPDGSQLALVSAREDHSFIGVYDFAQKSLRYLDPSVDRDLEPVWAPDGKQIAYLRLPATPEPQLFGPKRAGPPWSIRVADVATGAGREVWKAREGKGSVIRFLAEGHQLLWAADDRLVFPWEGDGWTHLYSVPLSGGAPTLMTPGDFEVENLTLAPDRREVVFNSNQDDTDRRHLWREAAGATRPTLVTSGQGTEWAPVVLSDGRYIALLRSDARWPARPALVESDGSMRDLAPESIPKDFPATQLVEPQPVMLAAADGLMLHGQIFIPAHAGARERHPAVVFFHGGSRRQMLLGWHYMQYYHNAYALNQYLASRGYIVLSVNYRSGIGYGMEFREALNYGPAGASEFNDVQGAGLYLRSRPDVDPARIGLWGGSYGGYLTALGLARASDLFACGVDFHGVHDWNLEVPHTLSAENPQELEEWARVSYKSSPLADVKTWRSPVLLIQGDDDRNVAFSNMVQLVEALRKQGVEFQQIVFPDEVHDFLTHEHWLTAYHAASDFFDGHLHGGR
ncbi:MAG TPA: prolyl oligopeptidase family serine peptidase [Terriglobia bacterium]|nr:prolyl oligopeptidase family serine peptidase [Terriglobia bacterium]